MPATTTAGGGTAERQEREHEQVGERAEDELGGELEARVAACASSRGRRPSRGIGRHRARRRAPQNGDWPRFGDQRVERAEVELARRGAAERHDRAGGDHVVEDQQLDDGERVGAVEVGADRELARAAPRAGGGRSASSPRSTPRSRGALVRDLPGHVQLHGAGPLGQDDPVAARLADDARQVGVRQRVAEGELAVEMLLVLAVGRLEGDDDVGVVALRPDVALRVGLAPVELGRAPGRSCSPGASSPAAPSSGAAAPRAGRGRPARRSSRRARACGSRAAPRRRGSAPGSK